MHADEVRHHPVDRTRRFNKEMAPRQPRPSLLNRE